MKPDLLPDLKTQQKWKSEVNTHFSKEGIQMANKYTKNVQYRCSFER